MKNILIVSGHTDTVTDSVANRTILEILAEQLPECQIDYLDRLYPDFKIDTAAEQAKLLWADVVVLQFPVFWFSFPSIMHRWMEQTFLHGFSHGSAGDKLHGKKLILSYTKGAPTEVMNFDEFFGVPLAEVEKNMKPRVIATSVNNIVEEDFATNKGLDSHVEGRIEILE